MVEFVHSAVHGLYGQRAVATAKLVLKYITMVTRVSTLLDQNGYSMVVIDTAPQVAIELQAQEQH